MTTQNPNNTLSSGQPTPPPADPNAVVDPTKVQPPATPPVEDQPVSFEDWLKSQPEAVKTMYNDHVTGLKNTVQATRRERDEVTRQLTALSKQLEAGSAAQKMVQDLQAQIENVNKRSEFLEEAMKPEIGCKNPKVAWLLVESEQIYNKNGSVDWEHLKTVAPELFVKNGSTGKVNAGSGTGGEPAPKADMNSWIRKAAGRG